MHADPQSGQGDQDNGESLRGGNAQKREGGSCSRPRAVVMRMVFRLHFNLPPAGTLALFRIFDALVQSRKDAAAPEG
jgi:hypothetical protein